MSADSENATRIAHTAEHAFIGSLQNLLGETLSVRKVEHRAVDNTAFIMIPHLELDLVAKAQLEVNSLISQGRKVIIHTFPSMLEAKHNFPKLRANEERIAGKIRVVEIIDHDVAACAKEHVENIAECKLFLVTRISKNGKEYEVDFVTGERAIETAVGLSEKMLKLCTELGANANTLESTARKVKAENEINFRKLKALSREKLDAMVIEGGKAEENNERRGSSKINIFKGVFSDLVDEEIREFAGKHIQYANTVIIVVNVNRNFDMANILVARSDNLAQIDCKILFSELVADGRGGGKPNFVTGVVKKEIAHLIVDKIADFIARMETAN